MRDLTWLELFSEDLAAPRGMLAGTLAIAGTRADPALSGTATLAGFAAELPALGLRLTQGAFELEGRADGAVRVTGRVRSGDGVLALDGSLDLGADDAPLVLALDGDDVTLANTPELQVIADPDLVLRWLPDRLEVRGTLAVPTASVDLESLDSSVPVSPDVVVVDPVEAPGEQPRARPLDLQLAVSLGDDVRLEGFGLDGRMTGAVTLRERPGRRATATGALQVTGAYRAYGQSLAIERARLGFASSPYDDPTLDIRAEREFDDVTVGVQVRGTARRPETTIVSTPAMDDHRGRKRTARRRRARARRRFQPGRAADRRPAGARRSRRRRLAQPRRRDAHGGQIRLAAAVPELRRVADRHRPGRHAEIPAVAEFRHQRRVRQRERGLRELAHGALRLA